MEKRYQVFVSSTFKDLQEERQQVLRSLLELNCMPCSMEYFPASDDEVWTAIQALIKDCDYYIVIVAGRYGSVPEDGLSYTRKEYEYAVNIGKPVMAFLHSDPDTISRGLTENDPMIQEKLEDFRALCKRRLCKDWSSPADLRAVVTTSLVHQMKTHPAIGWVRSDRFPDEKALETINRLYRESEALRKELGQLKQAPSLAAGLAQGGAFFDVAHILIRGGFAATRGSPPVYMGRTLYGSWALPTYWRARPERNQQFAGGSTQK